MDEIKPGISDNEVVVSKPGISDNEVVVDTHLSRQETVDDGDISNHRHDMFVGVHFPAKGGRARLHSGKAKRMSAPPQGHQNGSATPIGNGRPASHHVGQELNSPAEQILQQREEHGETPAQRVQFLLGADDEKESHNVFSEMGELFYDEDGNVLEWKETARWVKYEEDVDHGAGRWSKPHVATLSLHSLFELRKNIMAGTVCLDMDADNLFTICDLVLENMVATGQLDEEKRPQVKEALLRRHRHQGLKDKKTKDEKKFEKDMMKFMGQKGRRRSSMFPGIDRTNSESKDVKVKPDSDRGIGEIGRSQSQSAGATQGLSMEQIAALREIAMKKTNSSASIAGKLGLSLGRRAESVDNSDEHLNKDQNTKFLRKIPQGAEAANVLVGEVGFLDKPIIAFVRLSNGVSLESLTEVPIPTRFLFIMLGPPTNDSMLYKEIGRCIATLMSDEVFHDVAYKARDRIDLLAGIDEFLEQVTVLPPGSWDPSIRIEPPKTAPQTSQRRKSEHFVHPMAIQKEEEEEHGADLVRTGRLFGGLIDDLKRKAPHYLSDFTDGISIQCIASFIFMYIACVTPLITFGGLLGGATDDYIAAFESLIGGAVCGMLYHLFSGQPLTIIGSTGPILIFETIMFQLCGTMGIDYMSFRVWIGFWTCVIMIVLVATDASALVRYITRFTEEAFAALIAFIFIVEAFENCYEISHEYPVAGKGIDPHHPKLPHSDCVCEPGDYTPEGALINGTEIAMEDCEKFNGTLVGFYCEHHLPVPDVFFFSVILFFATFVAAYSLKMFKYTNYFPTKVRFMISDFGVFMAFILMTFVDYMVGIPTPKLTVPSEFQPTRPDRGWLIPIFGVNPWWTYFAAILPAMLCGILIFMDQQITAVIVNRAENKLKKGYGYHLDLLVIGLLLLLMSIFGMPWFVAATVLSINHVDSLRVMSETTVPGEPPKAIGVREQRVTGVMVFLVIGLSSLMTGVLKLIPMPVLFGIFLYMGIASLRGVQFVERVILFFIPSKHQPDYSYLRKVKLWRVHLFTIIQAICLALLWIIKTSKAAIVFPIMVLAIVFIRKLLDFFFTQFELAEIDDRLPEKQKKEKLDDEEREAQEEQDRMRARSGTLTVALENGGALSIPANRVTFNPHTTKRAPDEDEEDDPEAERQRQTAIALGNLRHTGTTHSKGYHENATSPTTRRRPHAGKPNEDPAPQETAIDIAADPAPSDTKF